MGFDFLDFGFPKSGTDWKSINGKPFITVSAKGRSNGLSTKINDGADFGPDTTLNATSLNQTGAPYTQTYGIQEAINYLGANGGTVFLRQGIYYISEIINMQYGCSLISSSFQTKINITGSGIYSNNQTLLTWTGTSQDTPYIFISNPNNSVQGFRIDGITFDAQPANGLIKYAIHLQDVVLGEITNCTQNASYDAFIFWDGAGLSSNLQIAGGGTVWIHHNDIQGSPIIYIDNNILLADIWITDNWCYGGHGYTLFNLGTGTNSIFIVGNKFEQNSSANFTARIGTLINQGFTGSPIYIKSESVGAGNYSLFVHDNLSVGNSYPFATYPIPSTAFIAHNYGEGTPLIPTTPAVPASGTAQQNTNPYPVNVYLYGGTVTEIQLTRNGTAYTVFSNASGLALSGQVYKLNPSDSITITYTTAPTWEWLSD